MSPRLVINSMDVTDEREAWRFELMKWMGLSCFVSFAKYLGRNLKNYTQCPRKFFIHDFIFSFSAILAFEPLLLPRICRLISSWGLFAPSQGCRGGCSAPLAKAMRTLGAQPPLSSIFAKGERKGRQGRRKGKFLVGANPNLATKIASLKPNLPIKNAFLAFQRRLVLMVYCKFPDKLNVWGMQHPPWLHP